MLLTVPHGPQPQAALTNGLERRRRDAAPLKALPQSADSVHRGQATPPATSLSPRTDSVERGRVMEKLAAVTVLQHVQTAAMAADDDGHVGVYNPAAARVLGVLARDVVGRDLESLASARWATR